MGDENYFGTTVKMDKENSQEKVEVGDVVYWPEGNSICIFFGKTPASTNESPKAYSPITENTFGVFLIFQEKPLAFP